MTARVPRDYFGREIRPGHKLLHISRRGSSLIYGHRRVMEVTGDGRVRVAGAGSGWPHNSRPAWLRFPEQTIIFPGDGC